MLRVTTALLASCDMSHAHATPLATLPIYASPMYPTAASTPDLAATFDLAVTNWASMLAAGDVSKAVHLLCGVIAAFAPGWF